LKTWTSTLIAEESRNVQVDPQDSGAGTPEFGQQDVGQLLLGGHVHLTGEGDERRIALPADPVSPDVAHGSFLNRQKSHNSKSAQAPPRVTPSPPTALTSSRPADGSGMPEHRGRAQDVPGLGRRGAVRRAETGSGPGWPASQAAWLILALSRNHAASRSRTAPCNQPAIGGSDGQCHATRHDMN
jgi:hypothetical protein